MRVKQHKWEHDMEKKDKELLRNFVFHLGLITGLKFAGKTEVDYGDTNK